MTNSEHEPWTAGGDGEQPDAQSHRMGTRTTGPATRQLRTTESILEVRPWPGRTWARILVVLNIVFTSLYVGWWTVGGHIANPWLFGLLAAAELFTISHLVGLWQTLWNDGVEIPPKARTRFSIDVLIPTYGEPLSVLRRTVAAAVAMHGEHTTYVLDDAVRAEVEELARDLGAEYIPRESSHAAKAGNLNHALERTSGDLVVVFDADHVARQDFLERLVPYFEDPKVGMVQSPQFYGNATVNPVARGAWRQQVVFYGPIMRGKKDHNASFLCGTNLVLRRRAIDDVGGFEESIVEDLATSVALHQGRWRSVYFPYILAEGEGPDTLRAYVKQQLRWAAGSLGLLRSFAPFRSGLNFLQRFQHLMASSYYLVGFAVAIYLTLPIVGLLFRIGPFDEGASTFLIFYTPHMLTSLFNLRRQLRGNFGLRHMQYTFGMFPTYIAAALSVLFGRDVPFEATGEERGQPAPPWLCWVTVLAFLAILAAMVVGPLRHGFDAWTITSMFWAGVNLLLLSAITWQTVKETWRAARGKPVEGEEPTGMGAPRREPSTYVLGRFEDPPVPDDVLSRVT